MTMTIFEGAGGRSAPAHGVLRPAVARVIVGRVHGSARRVDPNLLGLDDAGVATIGSDRRALEQAGRGQFPL